MSQYGQIPDLTHWQDYGMGGTGSEFYSAREPEDWNNMLGLYRACGGQEYGAFAEKMGIMSGEGLNLAVEVTPALYGNQILARTPMLELAPKDYRYMKTMRAPYSGMMALGDDGAVYEFDGTLGFFKRLRKAFKKVGRKIRKGVRRIIKKIPGGKYLIKLGRKVWKIAKKFVKPLVKFVGKYAAKLAPVAALIPGFGPAVAAGLYTAGKVANMMQKVGATVKKVSGGPAKLVFPAGSAAKKFQKMLKKAAKKEERRQKRGGRVKPMSKGRRRGSSSRRRSSISARRGMARRISRVSRRRGGSRRSRRSIW